MSGPLAGVVVVEFAGLGPAPFAGMVLSDLGAEVIRVDRCPGEAEEERQADPIMRGRRSIAVDVKRPAGRDLVLEILGGADGLIEGFRPGVMERLGLGPAPVLEANPRLVYGRMTGWGQDGPLAHAAGHDINYIAVSGALGHIGEEGRPPDVPLNLIGDYGGGGMLLVVGMLAGLLEARTSGTGQVVDAAMVDGAALLMAAACGSMARGEWRGERGTNLLDGGAPFYGLYETRDGRYVAIGSLERRFHEKLAQLAGVPAELLDGRMDRASWPAARRRMQELFATRTSEEWCQMLEGTDACFAPVLDVTEAAEHGQLWARSTYVAPDGVLQPAPAPRFDRTPGGIRRPPPRPGQDTAEVLGELGYDEHGVATLRAAGVVA